MIITIAVVGEPHVTKMAVYRSETMREVVARFSPNLDARLVEATIVSRPARPLYQTDEAFTNIQTGENGVEVKLFPMNDTINKLTPHPGGIDLIFDIPQRAENPNRVQYAKEKRDVGLAGMLDDSLIVAEQVTNFLTSMAGLTGFRATWLTAVIWTVVVGLVACARGIYKRKGEGRPLPEILTTESANHTFITIDEDESLPPPTMDIADSQDGTSRMS